MHRAVHAGEEDEMLVGIHPRAECEDVAIQEEVRIICSRDILFEMNVFHFTLSPKDF